MSKLRSKCHGAEAIKVYYGVTHDGFTHPTYFKEYQCSKCHKPCKVEEKAKEEGK